MSMNRRDFLYTGAAVTAAGMTARSYASIAGANDRVNLGVIGTGRRGTIVCGAGFLKDPRTNIVAVCDVYGKQVDDFTDRFKAKLSSPAHFVDYHDLLAKSDIDSVFIATPDHLHVQVACDAIHAKKNVYLEKPTLHRWYERKALEAAAAGSTKVLQCGMQQRSGWHYAKAKAELLDTKKLGDIVFVRGTWSDFPWQRRVIPQEPKPADLRWDLFLGPAPKVPWEYSRYTSWRSYHDYGNGVLADIMTHWVDVAQWLMSDAEPVKASALGGDYVLRGDLTNPDTVSAIVQYKNWNFNFESSVLSVRSQKPSVFFEGTEGMLDITREGYVFTPYKGDPVKVENKTELEELHTKNFLDAVTMGTKPNAPLRAGLDATLPVEMSLRSYWDKKTISRADLTT